MIMITLNKLNNKQIKDIFKTYKENKLWLDSESEEKANTERIIFFNSMRNFVNKVENALQKLNFKEGYIIKARYLNNTNLCDSEIYSELNISRSNYYEVKKEAFQKLSVLLYALAEGE